MTTATMNLPEKSIRWLQELIQTNIDSRDGFQEAAENLDEKSGSLEAMFRRLATERGAQANELQAMVASNAEKPTDSGSMAAAAHRTWMDLRAAIGGGEQAMLDEVERGEDHIKAQYETALNDLAGCACTATLRRHFAAVRASHDTVRDLRDAHARK